MNKILVRFQEFIGWLPLLVGLSLLGWIVLGTLERDAGTSAVSLLLELPVLCAYALSALGLSYLARRRFRKILTDAQQEELWNATLRGDRGALLIYTLDVIVWLGSLLVLLLFFWPAR